MLEDIIISEVNSTSSKFITAKKGKMFLHTKNSKLTLRLMDGAIHQLDEADKTKYQSLHFNIHNITIMLQDVSGTDRKKGLDEMTFTEINREIEKLKKVGANINPFLVELHKRASLPFACLSFTLLGIPLGLMAKRRSKSISFGISVTVIFGYYLLMVFGETLGIRGVGPLLLTMWAPNIIFSTLGIMLLIKAAK